MYANQIYYQVLSFVSFGPNGSLNCTIKAHCATFDQAMAAVKELKLSKWSIIVCGCLLSTMPMPDQLGDDPVANFKDAVLIGGKYAKPQ